MVVDCLIFSKNRACQLDALLRSIRYYAPHIYGYITILYSATEEQFLSGYDICKEENNRCRFIYEGDKRGSFQHETLHWLRNSQSNFIGFLTDDDIFFRPVKEPFSMPFSFRLGKNTSFSYINDKFEKVPPRTFWKWKDYEGDGLFGYPISLDGQIFFRNDIQQLIDFHFSDPTHLENGLWLNRNKYKRELLSCGKVSSLVSIPANRVTESSMNRISGQISTIELNDLYLLGNRIKFTEMDFRNIIGVHQEVGYVF